MKWPWKRRGEVLRRQVAETEKRQKLAEQLAEHSVRVSAALRREIEKNGFTELLQQAMGGR